jgi:hypothetical protein
MVIPKQGLAAILRILLMLFSCYAWVFCALHRLSTRRQHFTPSRTLPARGRAGWGGDATRDILMGRSTKLTHANQH